MNVLGSRVEIGLRRIQEGGAIQSINIMGHLQQHEAHARSYQQIRHFLPAEEKQG